ncbi:MAG: redox-sensing transcriptional repressor Rex [Bacteroidales bacterium]|nr:redox-sensing transcriptional repressor Rex [Bacteroidales bacterium]
MKDDKSLIIMRSTLSRLPIYYCYLQNKQNEGQEYVSSAAIAESLSLNPVQVRKDLASVSSIAGKPKLGFRTDQLIEDMKNFLGYNTFDDAILVGVGSLGRTLLQYNGFANYGLNIVVGFDKDPALSGSIVAGKPIMPMSKMRSLARRLNLHIGIIAVPADQAQGVADAMVDAGIEAIWNFAPTHINLPQNMLIKNENLAASLAVLSTALRKKNSSK